MAKKRSAEPETGSVSTAKTTTTVHLPDDTLRLLRAVAAARMVSQGGRPSVSRVVAELVEARRADLEAEINAAPRL